MFVPDDIMKKAVGSGEGLGPRLMDMMQTHFVDGCPFAMTKHSYPDRSVLKRAEETQSQEDIISTEEAYEDGCDDPYAWVAEHKSTERWTWECDRAERREASQASTGKQVSTKKVGCPVRYHLWLVNGRWVAGQTCNHLRHGAAAQMVFFSRLFKAAALMNATIPSPDTWLSATFHSKIVSIHSDVWW